MMMIDHLNKEKNFNIHDEEVLQFRIFLYHHLDKYHKVYKNLLSSNKNSIFLNLFMQLHEEIRHSLKGIINKK